MSEGGAARFTIAAAQTVAVPGDIDANAAAHLRFVAAAAAAGADLIVFPELSLTGYEPDLAAGCAMSAAHPAVAMLRDAACRDGLTILAGAPMQLAGLARPAIGAFVLRPDGTVGLHTKQHLHDGEEAAFAAGPGGPLLEIAGRRVAPAICADFTRPGHAATAAAGGADLYAVGALITGQGYAADAHILASCAARHRFAVLLANFGAPSGGFDTAGCSALWAPGGRLVVAADGPGPCLLVGTESPPGWSGTVRPVPP